MSNGRTRWWGPGLVGNLLTMGVIIVGATIAFGELSSRVNEIETRQALHVDLIGHVGMEQRERDGLKRQIRLEIQLEDLRRQIETLQRTCPDIKSGLNPTLYKSPPIDNPYILNPDIKQTSVP